MAEDTLGFAHIPATAEDGLGFPPYPTNDPTDAMIPLFLQSQFLL
jgi:hypothetical protein